MAVPETIIKSGMVVKNVPYYQQEAEHQANRASIPVEDRCPECDGTGHYADYIDAMDPGFWATCHDCRGTGRINLMHVKMKFPKFEPVPAAITRLERSFWLKNGKHFDYEIEGEYLVVRGINQTICLCIGALNAG